MLLHPGLYSVNQSTSSRSMPKSKRKTTRDVDYINREFARIWKKRGVTDATKRLETCIVKTAEEFGLGTDWMNSDADVALPLAYNSRAELYDPVAATSMTPTNVAMQTVYMSPNGQLTLIGISPPWALAFKFARYLKYDPEDIVAILISMAKLQSYTWTAEKLERLLFTECAPMQFERYDIGILRGKIQHAVALLGATRDTGTITNAYWPGAKDIYNATTLVVEHRSKSWPATPTEPPPAWSSSSSLMVEKKMKHRKSASSFASLPIGIPSSSSMLAPPMPSATLIDRPKSTAPTSSKKSTKKRMVEAQPAPPVPDYATSLDSWRNDYLARGSGVYALRPPPTMPRHLLPPTIVMPQPSRQSLPPIVFPPSFDNLAVA